MVREDSVQYSSISLLSNNSVFNLLTKKMFSSKTPTCGYMTAELTTAISTWIFFENSI